MEHIMVDIETMGTDSYSAIVSIGALEFDINTGKTGREFYTNVDLQSCIDIGLIVNGATIMWWLKQSKAAKESLQVMPVHIKTALESFSGFCNSFHQVWGNSARFDLGLLENAYVKCGMKAPWSFRNERCLRTLASFNSQTKRDTINTGVEHSALSDCYYQVAYCSAIWNQLNHD